MLMNSEALEADRYFFIHLRMFTLPWLPRKGLAKTGVRKDPSPKKRCIVYLRHKTRLITDK